LSGMVLIPAMVRKTVGNRLDRCKHQGRASGC
jgi:hypothetical protein